MSTDDLPKPPFPSVGRLYQAAVANGVNPANINMDRADSLIRILARSVWKNDNMDIYSTWNTGGDPWSRMVKDVREYSKTVARHRRVSKPTNESKMNEGE